MRKHEGLTWVIANAFGLALGFLAILQTVMLIEHGFDWDAHWVWNEIPVKEGSAPYFSTLVSFLFGGFVFGVMQGVFLRARIVSSIRWVIATAAGFVVLAVFVQWPLIALGWLGIIPGPVEPILATVGSGTIAGLFQYGLLRRAGINAGKWVTLWIIGLVASFVPMVILFISLDELGISLSWPMETFVSGFVVGGVAAISSGKAFFRAAGLTGTGVLPPGNRGEMAH